MTNEKLPRTFANKVAFVLLCAAFVFATLAYGAVHQPVIALVYLFIFLILVFLATDSLRSGVIRYSSTLLQVPLYLAAVYGIIQVIPFGWITDVAGVSSVPRTISFDPFWTQVAAVHFLALGFLFSAALVLLDSAKRISRLAMVITIFGFGYAFFAILQSVLSPDKIYGIYDAAAPFGSFVNRHNFAAAMEMMVAIPLGMLFTGAIRPDKRLLYVIAITLMGAAMLLSVSRGGLMAFLAAIIFLAIITTRGSGAKKLVLRVAMSLLLIAAVVGGAIFVGGDTSLTRIVDTAATNDVTTGRFEIWEVTLKMIVADLPFGSGLGAYGVAYTRFDTASGLARVEQAHNDYLQIAADAGIPGVLIALLFLFLLYKAGRRGLGSRNLIRRGIATGALAGIFAVLVHSLFDFVLHTTAVSMLFVLLLAILAAAGHEYPDDITDLPDDDRRRDSKHRPKAKIKSFPR